MKTTIKLWLDDIRNPDMFDRSGWTWVKNYDEAVRYFKTHDVVQASLDHDLDIAQSMGHDSKEKTGYHVVCWMEEHGIFPVDGVHVHSANPAGAKKMVAGLKAICRRKNLDENLVTVWPADVRRKPRKDEDPYNISHDNHISIKW